MGKAQSNYLSRRMPLGKGVRGWVIERPGLHLAAPDQASLLEDLREIARKTLAEGDLDYGIFDPASGAMERSVITVLYDSGTHLPIAFNSMPLLDVDIQGQPLEIVHLGLVMVDPNARSAGLSAILYGFACAMLLIRNQFRPVWVSSVTQVPAVVGLVSELYSETFPSPKPNARRSFEHLQIAKRIMRKHRSAFGVGADAGFDAETFIISNAYTGGSDNLKKTFASAPKHRNTAVNDLCESALDYARGDDFLQIGKLDVAALRYFLFRTLPGRSAISSTMALIFFAFQFVFLPIRHWFDADKPWGALRPWKT